jgi:hypothetical protein
MKVHEDNDTPDMMILHFASFDFKGRRYSVRKWESGFGYFC